MFSLYFMLVLCAIWAIFAAAPALRAGRRITIPRIALAGLLCYGLSYLLNEAWALAENYDLAVLLWQAGLTGICLMYFFARAIIWRADGLDFLAAALALILLGVAQLEFNRHILEAGLIGIIVLLCARCFLSIDHGDVFGRLAWAILLIAEAASWPLYLVCRVAQPNLPVEYLRENWGEVTRQSCERALGPMMPHVATVVTFLALAWLVYRWYRPRGGSDGRSLQS